MSGGDDGVVKVWDLRQIQSKKSVALFKHHGGPITSIEWCPQDSSVFAASGEDHQVTQVVFFLNQSTSFFKKGLIILGKNQFSKFYFLHSIDEFFLTFRLLMSNDLGKKNSSYYI